MCSICEEESTHICARCTKDTCHNHLCEKCLRCSDCCECEVALTDHTALGFAAGSARAAESAGESAHLEPAPEAEPVEPHSPPNPFPAEEPGPEVP
jgi:hypothetical protein